METLPNYQYKIILCGGGPANMGLFVNAYLKKSQQDLIAEGLAIIEKSDVLGTGKISDYKITANSLGSVFTENLEEEFKADISFQELIKCANTAPYLLSVANFQRKLCETLLRKTANTNKLHSYISHEVRSIQQLENGIYRVISKNLKTDEFVELTGKKILLNLGGYQDINRIEQLKILNNIKLREYSKKLILSEKIIFLDKDQTIKMVKEKERFVIVGGSHSAFSVALKLSEHAENLKKKIKITILHRNEIKLFFATTQEAKQANYQFNPLQDVCPLSGRVNRFGGLRYDKCSFAMQAMKLKPSTSNYYEIELIQTTNKMTSDPNKIKAILKNADAIIPACGYQPRLVPIYDFHGKEMELMRDPDGGLYTDHHASLYHSSGKKIDDIYAFGLGAGLRPSPEIGGEPSYKGRLDGIWLYQNDIGNIVYKSLNS